MIKKILSFFVLCALMVLPARAELKVDIVAGGSDPISIAVQKFEVAGDVRMSMIIVAALIEGATLFAIVVCLMAV